MGNLYTPTKTEYFWRLLSFLTDQNIYVTDKRVVPYTPDLLQDYVAFFPDRVGQTLQVVVQGNLVGSGLINTVDGLFSVKTPVPLGPFTLEVKDLSGNLITSELFTAKNYATFLGVSAQSYEERRVAIEQAIKDTDWATIRSERLFPVVGAYFEFSPPPGWTAEEYRRTLLGELPACPGFIRSFFYGGTLKGVVDTIKSITCSPVTVRPAQDGDRWVVFDEANAPNPLDTLDPDAWFVANTDAEVPPPNQRAFVMEDAYIYSAVRLEIEGAARTVVDEQLFRSTDSFIESPTAEAFALDGKTLSFTVEQVGDSTTKASYFTTFGAITTAADAAAAILAQNPSLTSAVYAEDGKLRIGVAPEAGIVRRITIVAGSSLVDLGFTPGDSVDVGTDVLANPNQTTPVSLVFGTTTFTEGVEFNTDTSTGEIVWLPSTAVLTTIPPRGSVLLASYSYLVKREIEDMVNKIKDTSLTLEYVYV